MDYLEDPNELIVNTPTGPLRVAASGLSPEYRAELMRQSIPQPEAPIPEVVDDGKAASFAQRFGLNPAAANALVGSQPSPAPELNSAIMQTPVGEPIPLPESLRPRAVPVADIQMQPEMPTEVVRPKPRFDQGIDLEARAYNQMYAAQKGAADAELQAAKEREAFLLDQQRTMELEQRKQREAFDEASRNISIANEEYKKLQVKNPFADASTGTKIAAGIAIALGGIGQALAGGENQALKIINQAIDRDIDLQIKQINKKGQELDLKNRDFQALRARFQDDDQMRSFLKANALERIAARADVLGASAKTAQARANADLLKAKALQEADLNKAKVIGAQMDVLKSQMEMSGQGQGQASPELMTPFGPARTKEDANKIKDAYISYQRLKSSVQEMRALRERNKGAAFFGPDVAKGKSLAKATQLELKNLAQLGVLSEGDIPFLEEQIPSNPLGVSPTGAIEAKFDQLESSLDSKMKADLSVRVPGYEHLAVGSGAGNQERVKITNPDEIKAFLEYRKQRDRFGK